MAVAGIGETDYYRHGGSPDPEFKLALKAILNACDDAGLDPHDIEGFASYSDDRSEASRLAAALGIRRLRSAMQWGGGVAVATRSVNLTDALTHGNRCCVLGGGKPRSEFTKQIGFRGRSSLCPHVFKVVAATQQ